MHQVWQSLAFQLGEGGLPYAPDTRAGPGQGEALPSELQDVRSSSQGGAQHHLREHRHPSGESGGQDKN